MTSIIEKFLKFFLLETERDFDNRAVMGGFEKARLIWLDEANIEQINPELIESVDHQLIDYADLSIQEKEKTIKKLIEQLSNYQNSSNNTSLSDQNLNHRKDKKGLPKSKITPSTNTYIHHDLKKTGDRIPEQGLKAPITVLPGIGPRHAETFTKLGINALGDLLFYFPRRYDDYSMLKPISHIMYGDELTIIVAIKSIASRPTRAGRQHITEVIVEDGTGSLRINWFNQPWLDRHLKHGDQIVVSGKVDMYLGRLVMNSPDWEPLEREHLHTNRIVPIYPLTTGVKQHQLRKIMHQTVKYWANRLRDFLPESIIRNVSLMDLSKALEQIHFPDTQELLENSRYRLAFDEVFLLQLGVLRQKQHWQSLTGQKFLVDDIWLEEQLNKLPFELTEAQHRVVSEIREDLAAGSPMNRLLQGDVGSGKTIISWIAASIVATNGGQIAIMAPTSILADQHYRNFLRFISSNDKTPIIPQEIQLLLGDTSETKKKEIREGLSDGSIKLVVGTHALLEDPIVFKNLSFVTIDEQHRFGVDQRATLRLKGNNPHLLVMTATPIPRSLALTVYGDLELSIIDQLPIGRIPIKTYLLHPYERERAYQLIRSQVDQGNQAFIIYPLIDQGEREETKAAVDEHKRLKDDIFPDYRLALLHGRMHQEEKDAIMGQFRDGHFDVLISTSVVEVGVDIPNATVMLIEGANRFGLAQLHQIRGRVGRNNQQSFCLLIPETDDTIENERLIVMSQTDDGFILAERDLEYRGPGQFLGSRQSGFSELRLAQITDLDLIQKAREEARSLFQRDPDFVLEENSELNNMLEHFWGEGKGDFS